MKSKPQWELQKCAGNLKLLVPIGKKDCVLRNVYRDAEPWLICSDTF